MTAPDPATRARETLIGFARAKAEEAQLRQASRMSMAATWKGDTEASHEDGRKLAEQMSGRPMRKHSAAERERLAAADERIAAKYAEEAAAFDAIAAALAEQDAALAEARRENEVLLVHHRVAAEFLDEHARLKAALAEARRALAEIIDLSAGWDEDGSTGPRPPLSWESVGRMAMDYARAALPPQEREGPHES